MVRDKLLQEKYEKITESNAATPVRERDKALFERLLHNEVGYLSEQTFSGDMASLGQILVPVFRRAFPQMIGKDIVGVQPMKQPTGYAFALRYHFVGNTAGNGSNRVIGGGNTGYADKAVSPYTWTPQDNQKTTTNSLILVYSSTAERQADAPDTGYGDAPNNGTNDLSGIATIIYTEDNKAVVRGDVDAIKAAVDASGTGVTDIYDNEAGFLVILKNYPGPLSTLVGEQLGNDMSELGLTIDKIAIEAKTRKLKARYTLESAQDLKSVHGKDMASELIDILTYEITQAIDREIIDTINAQAVATTFNMNTDADGRWELEKFRTLYTEIVRKSNDIARTTLRGPGNIIIASPDVITVLEQLPTFTGVAPIAGTVDSAIPQNNLGQALVGTIGGRFSVYRDTFASSNYATVGYKGASAYDTGVIWSPYVPIMMKETTDQESGNPNIIFMERSAISANIFASDLYYRKINVTNLFA
jgi:hypothetical protein